MCAKKLRAWFTSIEGVGWVLYYRAAREDAMKDELLDWITTSCGAEDLAVIRSAHARWKSAGIAELQSVVEPPPEINQEQQSEKPLTILSR